MKHFFYIIAIISLVATLTSCTAEEIETDNPKVQADVQADVDPKTVGGSLIPPKD
jgi:hypothetical protein